MTNLVDANVLSEPTRQTPDSNLVAWLQAHEGDLVIDSIVLLAALGLGNDVISARLDTPRQIVSKWRKRFFEERLAGLEELPRGGRPALFSPQRRRRRQGTRLRAPS